MRAYLKVIEAEPEMVKRVMAGQALDQAYNFVPSNFISSNSSGRFVKRAANH
jgi:hypothetical protein